MSSIDQNFKFMITNDCKSYEVIGYADKLATKIEIPKTYKDKLVTGIGKNCFRDFSRLTRVDIPEGIEVIEEGAFSNSGLKYIIELPSTLKRIEKDAFSDCESVTEFLFGMDSQLEYIGENAFGYCSSLEGICLADTVKYIGSDAFAGCYSLEMVMEPRENMIMPSSSVFGYGKLSFDVYLPRDLKTLGTYVFDYCDKLRTFHIHSSIERIGRFRESNRILDKIAFTGTEEQWNEIDIDIGMYTFDEDEEWYKVYFKQK